MQKYNEIKITIPNNFNTRSISTVNMGNYLEYIRYNLRKIKLLLTLFKRNKTRTLNLAAEIFAETFKISMRLKGVTFQCRVILNNRA